MLTRYLKLISLAAVAACANPSHPDDPGGLSGGLQVNTGQQFDIAAGQSVQVRGTGISILFSAVSEDSRCPSDVQCVWAGNAVVRLNLSSATAPATEARLNTTLDPKSVGYAGQRISLVGLKPSPRSGTTIPSASYVATLEVGQQ
jgi:hypothetical protein